MRQSTPLKIRLLVLTIPFLVLTAVLAIIFLLESRRPPAWQTALDNYLSQRRADGETVTLLSADNADYPRRFRADMGQPARDGRQWDGETVAYPPIELRCLLLERATSSQERPFRQVIYLAYHSDNLWRQGWLIHESSRRALLLGDVADHLQTLGCDLPELYQIP